MYKCPVASHNVSRKLLLEKRFDIFAYMTIVASVETMEASALEKVGIRNSVIDFATDMEIRLRENDHKGGWENCDLGYLREKLGEEIGEVLQFASESDFIRFLTALFKARDSKKHINARFELADAGNILMMISDNIKR